MVRREIGGATDPRGHTPEPQGLAVNFWITAFVGRAGSACARVGAPLELTHHRHLAELNNPSAAVNPTSEKAENRGLLAGRQS
jgi:hypothetical protein